MVQEAYNGARVAPGATRRRKRRSGANDAGGGRNSAAEDGSRSRRACRQATGSGVSSSSCRSTASTCSCRLKV